MPYQCQDIMITEVITITPTHTFKQGLDLLRKYNLRYLPVIDENGDFAGLFSILTVISLLIPQSIQIDIGIKNNDLSFMTTNMTELKEKIAQLNPTPISDYLNHQDMPVCNPQSSIMEAMLMLHKCQGNVVITAPDSRKFLGLVTKKSLIDQLTKD